MGKQPAVIFIARHGARLDQADRNWTATAEAPYDPPLSYGGWIQCQSLGLRISNELYALDKAGSGQEDVVQGQPRKKRKIIIHSSPYLRCVQTSSSIAAGIQHPQNHARMQRQLLRARQPSNTSPSNGLPETAPETEENSTSPLDRSAEKNEEETNRLGHNTCQLRIDAFLGEWQSPNYFHEASYPPPSVILVSQAKMGLKKPQEDIKGADLTAFVNFNMPVIDVAEEKENATSAPAPEMHGLRAMAAAGHAFSKRPRNKSFGTELANGARMVSKTMQRPMGYNPPLPNYAISSSDKIPPGFVAHARDACLDFDLDWDSQGPPLDWGDGGPNDEEWSRMHRRFRNGLQKLIGYYEVGPGAPHDDDNEDLVIILVSHQAGCNALIRLLTGAPALIDVGLSSLSMAVRKDAKRANPDPPSPTRRRGSLDLSISEDYDMKIIASTEHLRAGSNPLGLNSPRLGMSPALASRRAVGADSPDGFTLGEASMGSRGRGSMMPGRSSSHRSYPADALDPMDAPVGLWRKGSQYSRDETADSSDAGVTPGSRSITPSESVHEDFGQWEGGTLQVDTTGSERQSDSHLLPVRSASQRGLWGGESISRSKSPGKRRWTAVERSP